MALKRLLNIPEIVQNKTLGRLHVVLAVLYWILITAYAFKPANIPRPQFAVAFVAGSVLVYLVDELRELKEEDRNHPLHTAIFTLIAVVVTAISVYIWTHYHALRLDRIGFYYEHEYIMAAMMLIILGYLVWREFGWTFGLVYAGTFIYAYYGYYFPGMLGHFGFGFERILGTTVLGLSGLYGNITVVVGTWIAPFLLFSGLVQAFGAFELIIRAAMKLAEYIKSGIAQSAVVASMAVGSINGAAVANTAITGSITIPLMKENGIEGRTAGGIESVASSGGQIMPPIMGASAFLMANLLQIPYADIIVAALVPALIFYIIVALNVHLIVSRHIEDIVIEDLSEVADFDNKRRTDLFLESMQFLIPMAFLLYMLGILRYSIMYTAFMTVGVTLLTTGLYQIGYQDRSFDGIKTYLARAVEGGRLGAVSVGPIAIIVATISVVIKLLLATGIPNKLALSLMEISGGSFLGVVLMAFVISIILGMGMPTVGAYLIVALIVAPTIIGNFAIPDLATHFFVFYCAILSALTPPIAVAVIVASGIANSNFWRTVLEAMRIGFPMFLLPFIFVYQPVIVSESITVDRVLVSLSVFLGMIVLSIAFNSGFSDRLRFPYVSDGRKEKANMAMRLSSRLVLVAAGAGILFVPNVYVRYTILVALTVGVVMFLKLGTNWQKPKAS